jgi:hypothetical protein
MTYSCCNIENPTLPDRKRRIRFVLFVKVLFKLIDDKVLRDQAKGIIASCIQQQKRGISKYTSLMHAIQLPLRGLVGNSVWLCAYHYTELYQNRKRYSIQTQDPTRKATTKTHTILSSSLGEWGPEFYNPSVFFQPLEQDTLLVHVV